MWYLKLMEFKDTMSINDTGIIACNTGSANIENPYEVHQAQDEPVSIYDEVNSSINTENGETVVESEFLSATEINENSNDSKSFTDKITSAVKTAVEKSNELAQLYRTILKAMGGLNNKIDYTKQGKIGDCWLLAALDGIRHTEGDGGSKFLEKYVQDDFSGFKVNFKGLNKTAYVSLEEISDAMSSKEYSDGDADVVLMELAFEKARDKNNPDGLYNSKINNGKHAVLCGGNLEDFIHDLTGSDVKTAMNYLNSSVSDNPFIDGICKIGGTLLNITQNKLENALDEIKNSDNIAAVVGFAAENGNERFITDINGVQHTTGANLEGNHGWSIKSIDGDNITMTNPWDSREEVTISKQELLDNAYKIEYFDINS